ncbi:UNVERIFIED_CONTAM: hypothetical protein Sradi_1301200 [Sesamum radiatum]|uniref:Uncharacterized protein n=1 Tax=Sesamum radiatum TaxID=300843 RepID=A0AAW2UR51_SESRA
MQRNATKYHAVSFSIDNIILEVQRHLRISLEIWLGMYTLHIMLHWHRDQCDSRAHCRLAGFGVCPGTRSSPLGGGGGCHGGD